MTTKPRDNPERPNPNRRRATRAFRGPDQSPDPPRPSRALKRIARTRTNALSRAAKAGFRAATHGDDKLDESGTDEWRNGVPFLPKGDWKPKPSFYRWLVKAHARPIEESDFGTAFESIADTVQLYHAVQVLVDEECRRRGLPTPENVATDPSVHVDTTTKALFDNLHFPTRPWTPTLGDLHRLAWGLRDFTDTLTTPKKPWKRKAQALATLHWLLHHGPRASADHVVPHDPHHCAC